MKKFYNKIKYILPMIIPLLIAMILLPFITSDWLFSYRYGGVIYVYSWLIISMTSQLIFLKIKKML